MATPNKLKALGDDPVGKIVEAVNRYGDQRVAAEKLSISPATVCQVLKQNGYKKFKVWVKQGSSKESIASIVDAAINSKDGDQ
jgi:hypothetical protein